ncbi:hypothetical protein EZS27_010892 [termite gut metagenome]|uniref:Calcineurin-like phosphoesterase domain-containing protein n=1 Tax=termite gut metagenome TaxID=433724 RepID=A0A5J4S7B5_9ZZZZ
MNKVYIVPDVHGRRFWENALTFLRDNPNDLVIFLGDYTDPYPGEGITDKDAYFNFLSIIEFKNNVVLLIGNHELHYIDKSFRCQRYSKEYYHNYHRMLTDDKDLFQICKKINSKYVFTHAGILKGWYDKYRCENIYAIDEQLNDFFLRDKVPFGDICNWYNWGKIHCEYSSPLWADIREHVSEELSYADSKNTIFRKCSGYVQVFGHTQLGTKKLLRYNDKICLDTKSVHLLDLTTGKFDDE